MAKRQKKTIISGITKDAAEEAFAVYAKAEAEKSKITAEIELKCARIREQHQEKLTQLQNVQEESFAVLQSYAMENQEELFRKRKSLEMVHGTIGFRTGTPKLKTLKGFTWESAKNLVKIFLPSYIRKTEEIAKDKLLADKDMELQLGGDPHNRGFLPLRDQLSEVGIQIVQEETFYVEPKKEES